MKSTTACDGQLNPDPAVADEASRVVDRLRSSDPQFDDCDDAATLIEGLKADIDRYIEINAELATELAKLAQQEPIKYLYRVIDCFGHDVLRDDPKGATILETVPLFAAPVPAPHKGATHCDDCGLTWLDDGLNPLWCPYCKVSAPAPAVPAEWREVIAELSADLTAHLDACYPNRDTRTRSKQFYDAQMKNVYRARALLQSAEVKS